MRQPLFISALAALVLVTAIGFAAAPRAGRHAGTGSAAAATATARARGSTAPSSAPTPATSAPATPAKSAASPRTGAAAGGPLATVESYFADLAAGRDQAAYLLVAPAWRRSHSLVAFVSGLPAAAPRLGGSRMASVADFDATVQVTLAGGSAKDVSLVDVSGGSGAPRWRLISPP